MQTLSRHHLVNLTETPPIALFLRDDTIGHVTAFRLKSGNWRPHFLKASAVTEEQFYATGHLVGIVGTTTFISIAAPVPVLADDIEAHSFTMKNGTLIHVASQSEVHAPSDSQAYNTMAHQCLINAARHASGEYPLPALSREAAPGKVPFAYPPTESLTQAA